MGHTDKSVCRPEGKVLILCNIVLSVFPLYDIVNQHVVFQDPWAEPARHLGGELSLLLVLVRGQSVEGVDWVGVTGRYYEYAS